VESIADDRFDFLKTAVTRDQAAWTVQLTVRRARKGEGPGTWPRVRDLEGRECIVLLARAWLGGRDGTAQGYPVTTWIFRPVIAATTDGTPTQLRKVQHILDAAGLKWKGGGRPLGSRKGRVWERQDYIDWYREASQAYAREDTALKLEHLGEAMGVSDDTARRRAHEAGFPWPPEAYLDIWDPDDS
jgi:hypothetical protein